MLSLDCQRKDCWLAHSPVLSLTKLRDKSGAGLFLHLRRDERGGSDSKEAKRKRLRTVEEEVKGRETAVGGR